VRVKVTVVTNRAIQPTGEEAVNELRESSEEPNHAEDGKEGRPAGQRQSKIVRLSVDHPGLTSKHEGDIGSASPSCDALPVVLNPILGGLRVETLFKLEDMGVEGVGVVASNARLH